MVYNDLHTGMVSLMRCLSSDSYSNLVDMVSLTPYSKKAHAESFKAFESSTDPSDSINLPYHFYTAQKQCFSGITRTWSRTQRNNQRVVQWMQSVKTMGWIRDMFSETDMRIYNGDFFDAVARHDSTSTLNYLDPPYLPDTRAEGSKNVYFSEMSVKQHVSMCKRIRKLKGMVILAGYDNDTYDTLLPDWHKVFLDVFCRTNLSRSNVNTGMTSRTEVMWLSPNLVRTLPPRLLSSWMSKVTMSDMSQ